MIAEIHVSPSPSGTAENRYAHVEAAIAVVQNSGLHHEVAALGTTFEGPDDAVWTTLRAAHDAVLACGATSVITSIRLGARTDDAPSMDELTGPFRS